MASLTLSDSRLDCSALAPSQAGYAEQTIVDEEVIASQLASQATNSIPGKDKRCIYQQIWKYFRITTVLVYCVSLAQLDEEDEELVELLADLAGETGRKQEEPEQESRSDARHSDLLCIKLVSKLGLHNSRAFQVL